MKASDLFVKCLEAEGVSYIFGIPGEENIDLMDALSRSTIEFVLCRHEQAAAFMADVYGRITGTPGVCLATLGPGATNLVTGVANAHLDRAPLIAITGQAARTRLHKESHQNVDTIALFAGITKYNQAILTVDIIPEVIRKAFALAVSGNPGAVHIQLPEDVASSEVAQPVLPRPIRAKMYPDLTTLQVAADRVQTAKRPLVLAGNGVIRGTAWAELRKFAEDTGLPVVNTFMAKGLLPFEHPQNLFTVGSKPYPSGLRPIQEADLIVAVGFDLVEYDPAIWNSDRSRPVIHIHQEAAEIDTHYPVAVDLTGDLIFTLRALAGLIPKSQPTHEFQAIRERRMEELTTIPNDQEALPRQVMWALNRRLPENATLISDVGLHKVWVSRWYHPKAPNRTIIYNGFASMGASLPGAIACVVARPDEPVVVVSGDGGFLMNAQELETAQRLGIAFTAIVFNDGRYSLIEKKQRDAQLAVTQIAFTNPDFRLFAQSFGVDYRCADSEAAFETALDEALNSQRLNIIEVKLGSGPKAV